MVCERREGQRGTGGGGGTDFDTGTNTSGVSCVTIWSANLFCGFFAVVIRGIQLDFNDGNTCFQGIKEGDKRTFEHRDINKIVVHGGWLVDALEIKTRSGNSTGRVGGRGGYEHTAYEGEQLVGMYGAAGHALDRIGFTFRCLPTVKSVVSRMIPIESFAKGMGYEESREVTYSKGIESSHFESHLLSDYQAKLSAEVNSLNLKGSMSSAEQEQFKSSFVEYSRAIMVKEKKSFKPKEGGIYMYQPVTSVTFTDGTTMQMKGTIAVLAGVSSALENDSDNDDKQKMVKPTESAASIIHDHAQETARIHAELEGEREHQRAALRQRQIEQLQTDLDGKNAEIEEKDKIIAYKEKILKKIKTEESQYRSALLVKEAELEANKAVLKATNAELKVKDALLIVKDAELEAAESKLETKNLELKRKDALLLAKEKELLEIGAKSQIEMEAALEEQKLEMEAPLEGKEDQCVCDEMEDWAVIENEANESELKGLAQAHNNRESRCTYEAPMAMS